MKIKLFILSILVSMFYLSTTSAQSLLINEAQASNLSTILDEDSETSDWLEIFNFGISDVNLTGYSLSDDKSELQKWVFPNITLKPNNYLLVFASDKNRKNFVAGWQTIINKGDIWKYKIFSSEPTSDWKNIGYNDISWSSGPSGFGYGDNDDATIVPATLSLYLRKTFTITDTTGITDAFLHVDYDDGFVAYLNGVEITRQNLGNPGETVPFNVGADDYTEAVMYSGDQPYAFQLGNLNDLLVPGENVLAIQVHNNTISSSDLTLIPFFTIGLNYTVQDSNAVNPLLSFTFPRLHTNFKISSAGESLYLTSNSGQIIDSLIVPALSSDISYGRAFSNFNSYLFFDNPTPESQNADNGFVGFTPIPEVSHEGGFYNSSFSINITNASEIEKIYYSIDGSEPDSNSLLYSNPFLINQTKVIRFIGYSAGKLNSAINTNTYLFNSQTIMPIVSISTDPQNLWDNETGIYVLGNDYDPSFPHFGANFWQDWEKTIHLEIFEPDGVTKYKSGAGLKIHGNWSRALPQKSLAIFARGEYGNKEFEYKLFPNRPFTKYNNFVLRNSGQDWESTLFRDLLMQNIVEDLDLDLQAGRPSVVYLNGVYWGIHNIREKLNEDLIASHHGLSPDEINILENNSLIVEGTNERYIDLINYITNNSLTSNDKYQFVKTQMEIDNYIDYELAQIYYANVDWPGNNIKYWTSQSDTSKWRWLIFDTDFSFGLFDNNAAIHNTLNFALEPNGPNWPNPPWSTLLLRKLMENQEFKHNFINRFADLSNSVFKKETVTAKIDSLKDIYNTEINRHITKWSYFSYTTWLNKVNYLKSFASARIPYLTLYFLQKFNIASTSIINLNVNDVNKGELKINRLVVTNYPWNGVYFKNIPVKVTAVPKSGYKFIKWSGINNSTDNPISFTPTGLDSLKAIFDVDTTFGTIVINEINYNSISTFDTDDWIELYNTSQNPINISGWIFKDSDDSHSFIFPSQTFIQGNDYLVVCIDTQLVKNHYPSTTNIIGNTGFGLSGSGELIRLFDSNLAIVDSLTYKDKAPWPTKPDGQGASLSLINPDLDNSIPQNWKASIGYGTPGAINDIFTDVEEELTTVASYSLSQNYPNPFNPSTKIRFTIPNTAYVKLDVFNILGEKVATLCNEFLNAGIYVKEFNTFGKNGLASGIYFYKLQADNFVEVKKMILIK